eukprot:4914168-Pyramimonas_sp.AAC.1
MPRPDMQLPESSPNDHGILTCQRPHGSPWTNQTSQLLPHLPARLSRIWLPELVAVLLAVALER